LELLWLNQVIGLEANPAHCKGCLPGKLCQAEANSLLQKEQTVCFSPLALLHFQNATYRAQIVGTKVNAIVMVQSVTGALLEGLYMDSGYVLST